jgi:hypothetical protein
MRFLRGVGAVVLVILIFYLFPTLVEWKVASRLGVAAYLFIGDLLGCAYIALTHRKLGMGLYGLLVLAKFLLLKWHVISATNLIWVCDVLPTLALISLFVLASDPDPEHDGLLMS